MTSAIRVQWAEMKAFLDQRGLPCQFVEFDGSYTIVGMDCYFKLETFIMKEETPSDDQVDFETNYKPNGNKPMSDSDGNQFTRAKITQSGWYFQLHSIEVTTGKTTAHVNKDRFGNTLGFCTTTLYDASRNVTLTEALAKFTKVVWAPTHDLMALNGILTQAAPPASDTYLWVTASPGVADIPFGQGGINLKLAGTGSSINADGKAPKVLSYIPAYPTANAFEIFVEHALLLQHQFQLHLGIFRP